MQLVAEGALGLDDPVRKHLPALRLADARSRIEVKPAGRLAVDDPGTMRILLLRGEGIGLLPDYLARDTPLVRVLPKWTWMSGALSFVYPGQRFVPANVRTFIDTALAMRGGGS